MPLSGVISSYDHARFGASVSMPSVRRSHCPPHGPGRKVGSRPKGPAGQLVERAPQRVSVERARRLGVGQVEVAVDAGRRAPACAGRGRASPRRATAVRSLLPGGRLAEVRNLALSHGCEACRAWGRPRTRGRRARRARSRDRTRARHPHLARTGTRKIVRRSRRAMPRRCGRTRDRREARLRPCAAGFPPTGRTTRAHRSKCVDSPARRRAAATSSETRFQGSAEEPSTASTQGVRAASSEAGTSKPLAGCLPETGYDGFGS